MYNVLYSTYLKKFIQIKMLFFVSIAKWFNCLGEGAMTWQGKGRIDRFEEEEESSGSVVAGPAGSGACVIVRTVAVEVAEMTVTVIRPVPWSRSASALY